MKIKEAFRYQINDYKKSIIIYYAILLLFYFFLLSACTVKYTTTSYSDGSGQVITETIPYTPSHQTFSGLDFITLLFIIFVGYSALRNFIKPMIQNGISRRTMYISHCFTSLTIVFIMTILNEILLTICKVWAKSISTVNSITEWSSLYENVYPVSQKGIGALSFHTMNFLYMFSLFLCFITISYMVSLIYYRIDRAIKILINVAIISYFAVFRTILDNLTNFKFSKARSEFYGTLFGVSDNQPVKAILVFIILAILSYGISWLLIRKISVKD